MEKLKNFAFFTVVVLIVGGMFWAMEAERRRENAKREAWLLENKCQLVSYDLKRNRPDVYRCANGVEATL